MSLILSSILTSITILFLQNNHYLKIFLIFFDIFDKFVFVKQPETKINGELCGLGTGDAVSSCLPIFKNITSRHKLNIIILSGDVPFIHLDELHSFSKLTNAIMVSSVDVSKGYGRVFFNNQGFLDNIVEHAFCDQQQLTCTTVNAGVYNLTSQILHETIPNIEINSVKKEFFTDFYKYTDTPISCFSSLTCSQKYQHS